MKSGAKCKVDSGTVHCKCSDAKQCALYISKEVQVLQCKCSNAKRSALYISEGVQTCESVNEVVNEK